MHFCELQSLPQDASRQFFVFVNDSLLNEGKSFRPEFLYPRSIYNKDPITGFSDRYINISLGQTSNSTLPPILNAIEVFSAMRNTNNATDARDVHIYVLLFTTLAIPVDAMMGIKEFYQVKKNWNGDPCAPKIYMWDGLNCSSNASGTPRITTLNLSHSRLAGEISTFFANLRSIQYLDLSHNNLTGLIPAALASIASLRLLDLRNNQLNGSVPSALLERSENGLLTLRPTLIHRDIKSKNILLNDKFEAMISDLGLSRALQSDVQTHASTRVVGTLGYLDPEFHRRYQLTKKTDAYSFGVVILELITGQRPILQSPERYHIVEWVKTRLSQGSIDEVLDVQLQGVYDANSAWKCIDIAIKCTAQASVERPTIANVVVELTEILQLEMAENQNQNVEVNHMNENNSFEAGQNSNTWKLMVKTTTYTMPCTGFLYIDCGLPANTSYTDLLAGITYISDDQFIDTGKSYNVSSRYANNHARQYYTVRSFPDGDRNCYILNTIKSGMKYLIRAAFLYGNYDLKNTTPQFDLYLDVNLWKTMNVTDPSRKYLVEAIIEPTAHRVSVCLVNTGQGTPFISGLDLRPIESSLYPMVKASGSLVLLTRLNLGGTYEIRFPFDAYDRYWLLDEDTPSWMKLSTNSSIQYLADDPFQVPSVVMQSAVYPANSTKLELILKPDSGDLNEYFAVMHFSELQSPSQNDSRQFFVSLNGALLNEAQSLTPEFLISQSVYSKNPCTGTSDYYNISLSQTSNSTLPPMLNAIEVFSAMTNINIASHIRDVDAMMAIKKWYQVKKNWNGDPCAPKLYVWDGLNCTFNASASPRVITVNLSNSELTGEINTYFANLGAVQYLDLSHNNLTGPIPAGLAYLPSLKLLDLRNNQLNGSVPSSLLTRSQNGSLTLRFIQCKNYAFQLSYKQM
ncbi:hypothetical protein Cni_G19850 [Canna indica]|uniref:Protein kinase domain-containing protein n=1 Tax=Canna indica TaxID=4628 RepID=A0AAQ3KMU0_9LILI|nr:hypothetical protein Cni_G19850 [Canna indica]